MSDTDSKQLEESERKRKSLALLLAICQSGDRGSDFLDVYLEAVRKIPADVFCEACMNLTRTWEDLYTFPRPAHVLAACRKVVSERRTAGRLRHGKDLLRRDEAEAMPPGTARKLLAKLEQQPEPETASGKTAREIRRSLLRIAIGRGENTPRLKPETEETAK